MKNPSFLWPIAAPKLVCLGLLVACLLLCKPGFAQPQTPSATGNAEIRQLSAQDTIEAIHKLFQRKRRNGGFLVGGSAALLAVGAATYSPEPQSYFVLSRSEDLALGTIATSPFWVLGIIKFVRFNAHREKMLIANYQRTHVLPAFLRKKLSVNSARP